MRSRLGVALSLLVVLVLGACSSVSDTGGSLSAPSGVPMPVGDLPGWRMVFSDDFGGSSLGNRWGLHEGQPGGDQYSLWRPSHVQVADGMLHLVASRSGDQWVTGGVSNWESSQTYGKWDVRFRIDRSDEITYALLLWPQDEKWPPEIDFAEDAGGDRATTTATLHHRPGDQKVQRSLQGDFSVWHTVGVEWQPGEIRYTIDGRPWSTVVSDQVPDVPMWLGIQTQAGGCSKGFLSCPVAGTPARAELQVDWVTVYAPA